MAEIFPPGQMELEHRVDGFGLEISFAFYSVGVKVVQKEWF